MKEEIYNSSLKCFCRQRSRVLLWLCLVDKTTRVWIIVPLWRSEKQNKEGSINGDWRCSSQRVRICCHRRSPLLCTQFLDGIPSRRSSQEVSTTLFLSTFLAFPNKRVEVYLCILRLSFSLYSIFDWISRWLFLKTKLQVQSCVSNTIRNRVWKQRC